MTGNLWFLHPEKGIIETNYMKNIGDIDTFAKKIGFSICTKFDPKLLVPEERIREYCLENKCGNCGKNYTCPPDAGTLEELKIRLGSYSEAYLLQYSEKMDVSLKNLRKVTKSKNTFHKKVLKMEQFLRDTGIENVWGLIGGNCGICKHCGKISGMPCRHPDEARISLESAGIDVGKLLESLGLKLEFQPDKITWTGCVLYSL